MNIASNGMGILKITLGKLLDLILPQDKSVSALLHFSAGDMRRLLPKAKVVGEPAAVNLFDYGNKAVKRLVWSVKYKAQPEMLRRLAGYLYEEMESQAEEELLFAGIDKILVIPIPSNPERRKEKGFNQCELLVRHIEKLADKSVFDFRYQALQKTRQTPKQAELKREERLHNVQDSMQSAPLPADSIAFVVDDVYTTGATFNEARRALRAAGAKRVFGFFLAH